jgi:hypothetical protein
MIGALDMGGSSNQLIIYNGTNSSMKLDDTQFWSHSWLRYGADFMQERLLKYLYETHASSADIPVDNVASSVTAASSSAAAGSTEQPSESSNKNRDHNSTTLLGANTIENPCAFKGYFDVYVDNYVFVGTGRPRECVQLLEHLMWAGTEDGVPVVGNLHATGASNTDAAIGVDAGAGARAATATASAVYVSDEIAVDGTEEVVPGTQALPMGLGLGGGVSGAAGDGAGGGQCIPGRPCPVDGIVHPEVRGHSFYAMSVYYYALDSMRWFGPDELAQW